jgi:NAD(P)-dependent dehydrogenase (short-subunit alcohol dehydrogenase family)
MPIRRIRRSLGRYLRRRLTEPTGPSATWNVVCPGETHSWSGRTVAITGAAGLLGSETAAAFVRCGAIVHAIDIRADALNDLVARHGDRVIPHEADLADAEQVQRVALNLASQSKSLAALVHCVGYNDYPTSSRSISEESWQRVLAVNLIAPALVTEALAPLLSGVRSAGVVMLTSVNGRVPSPWPHYAAAKAGLAKLTRDLAAHLAPQAIRVNAVAPGWTEARGADSVATHDPHAPLTRSAIPVEAVVNAVLFLADPVASPCTTGQELVVDGGFAVADHSRLRQDFAM